MKYILSIIIISISCLEIYSQEPSYTYESENYLNEEFYWGLDDIQEFREINSGTKIVISYQGNWPEEMRGAFEYAVKLWEEVLPMSLPINITAKLEDLRGNVLSKTSYKSYNFKKQFTDGYSSPSTLVKSVILQEYHTGQQYRFFDEIYDESFFNSTDIIITYNQSNITEFDFSIIPNEELYDKYDFVTVVLRDIATGLGFNTTAIPIENELYFTSPKLSPYENLIKKSLGGANRNDDFIAATQGQVDLTLRSWGGTEFDVISLYAPLDWDADKSLRTFIPSENPITRLLSYEFGKGKIMRDLSGGEWDDIFCGALDWRIMKVSGPTAGSVKETGTSHDKLPFKGTTDLNSLMNNKYSSLGNSENKNILSLAKIIDDGSFEENQIRTSSYFSVNDYCKRFNCYSPEGPEKLSGLYAGGISVSVLKNDGTWDCVYSHVWSPYMTVNIEDLKLNYPESEYARGTTGGLRYRVTRCKEFIDHLYNRSGFDYDVKYYTRDFTPQKPRIKYMTENISSFPEILPLYNSPEDWFVDVEVGIGNIEGAEKVIIEQLDEGDEYPIQYEIPDFRKGHFTANLDRECSTQLTAISYNENGYTRGNTITIPSIESQLGVRFKKDGNIITILGIPESYLVSGNLEYTILPPGYDGNISIALRNRLYTNKIDISYLTNGIYILSLYMDYHLYTFKFTK